ncbi:unnamed protein product, partial [Meganyctiphanes norvegica]
MTASLGWRGVPDGLDRVALSKRASVATCNIFVESVALDLESEAHEHNRLLDDLDNDFTSGEGLLSGSLNRVKNILTSGRQNRKVMCYMAGFIIIFLIILSYLFSRLTSST